MGVSISVCGDGITESANLPVPRSSLAVAPCGLRCAYTLWRNLGWILRAESIAPAGFDARTERTQCSQQPHQTYPPTPTLVASPCDEAGLLQCGILRHLSVLLSSHGLVALGMCGSLETRCFSPKFNCQVVFKSTWHWNNKAKEYLATFMDFFKCLIWIKAVWLVPTAVQPGDRVSQCPAPWESRPYTVNEEAESCDCQDARGVL